MTPDILPDGVQSAFYLAGVWPMFVPGLNGEAWLSSQAFSNGRALLVIDSDISPERLACVADWALAASVDRLAQRA